jgi:hypothetical protein
MSSPRVFIGDPVAFLPRICQNIFETYYQDTGNWMFEEVLRPVVIEIKGVKIAFLGVVDKSSGPFRFAGTSTSGVAPLNTNRILWVTFLQIMCIGVMEIF